MTTEQDVRLQIRPGQTVRIHQKIKEIGSKGEEKERIQIFEGIVIGKHGGNSPSATFTVRKESHGVGVEKIFPLFSPVISNIEIEGQARVRRAKLFYLRHYQKKLKEVKKGKLQ